MLHAVLRRRANGETVEQIRPDLFIATGKRKGLDPSVASIYRALAAHEKTQAIQPPSSKPVSSMRSAPRRPSGDRAPPARRYLDPIDAELAPKNNA